MTLPEKIAAGLATDAEVAELEGALRGALRQELGWGERSKPYRRHPMTADEALKLARECAAEHGINSIQSALLAIRRMEERNAAALRLIERIKAGDRRLVASIERAINETDGSNYQHGDSSRSVLAALVREVA